jgi:ABC-type uncharacterized transport system substrate-binding protein
MTYFKFEAAVKKLSFCCLVLLLMGITFFVPASSADSHERYKVLVVFSHEKNAPWDVAIREEIERVLQPYADLTFFYMDTKAFLQHCLEKGQEAYNLYQRLKPDGIITVDDNAQSMFVVPYLKGKLDIPLMFCGVNADPAVYGYPTKRITGVLERFHLEESIALTRQLAGKIDSFSFMVKKGPVADILRHQLTEEKEHYSANLISFMTPDSLEEALDMARAARKDSDLLFLVGLFGLKNGGVPASEREIVPQLVTAFAKPTAGIAASVVKSGALSAVITNGREHGYRAATMLLKALHGTPVSQIPVTRNSQGERVVNVSTLKRLNLSPDPIALRGVELVRQQ